MSELNNLSSQEYTPTHESYGDHLYKKRVDAVHKKIDRTLNLRMEIVNDYPLNFSSEKYIGGMIDTFFSCRSLLELKRLNLLSLVTSLPPGESSAFSEFWSDGVIQKLDYSKFGIRIYTNTNELKEISNSIEESVESSDVALTLKEAYKHYLDKDEEITKTSFIVEDNPLVTGAILENFEIQNYKSVINPTTNDELLDIDSLASSKIQINLEKYANYDEQGHISSIKLPLNSAVSMEMLPDSVNPTKNEILSTPWKMRIQSDTSSLMQEVANLSNEVCTHFLDREVGKSFISALEESGLKFSNMFENFLVSNEWTSEFDDRYGGAYTQTSRVLAKIIYSDDIDRINSLFSSKDNNSVTIDQLKQFCSFTTDNKSLLVFQNIMSQLIDRTYDQNYIKNGTDKSIHLSKGACFDVAGYYVEANKLNKLNLTKNLGINFLEKTFGAETLLNSTEVLFNGIWLPRGSLFVEAEDEKLAFLRFTPFMFESRKDMVDAFGSEVLKGELTGNLDDVMYRLNAAAN